MVEKSQRPPQNRSGRKKKRPSGRPFAKGCSGNPATQFRPGVSGNPGGRPKSKLFREAYLAVLEAEDLKNFQPSNVLETVAKKIVEEAKKGKVQAANEIADRVEGKACQAVDLNVSDNPLERLYAYFDEEHEIRKESNRIENEKLKLLNNSNQDHDTSNADGFPA
jgi:hypothetical protein